MPNHKDRLWVDGCFDFFHHGHAGALMQARQLGNELYVGLHTDEEIAKNKGPTVMHLNERTKAVDSCKWSTKYIDDAPYVTDPAVLDHYECEYVVHGDDITTDANGYDCYQQVKDMGRFKVVKRTPNISTTDLIGRMLGSSKTHHLHPLSAANSQHQLKKSSSIERFKLYATDKSALAPHDAVLAVQDDTLVTLVEPSSEVKDGFKNTFFVGGGFDLFHPGHMEFLEQVHAKAKTENATVVVGLYDDYTYNQAIGENYPVMNLYERALCVLQCKYVDSIILGVPFIISNNFLQLLSDNQMVVSRVFHGNTPIITNKGNSVGSIDPYQSLKAKGIFDEIPLEKYSQIDSSEIIKRVLTNRRIYEERQRKKGVKAEHEKKMQS